MYKRLFLVLFASLIVFCFLTSNSYSMKTKNFNNFEKRLEKIKGEFKVIGEVTLKPGEEKSFQTYSFKPVTIDFKTHLTKKYLKKTKNEGIGIKKVTSLKYYLKDPAYASMKVLPDNGLVKFSVKNFEKFPITVKIYKILG